MSKYLPGSSISHNPIEDEVCNDITPHTPLPNDVDDDEDKVESFPTAHVDAQDPQSEEGYRYSFKKVEQEKSSVVPQSKEGIIKASNNAQLDTNTCPRCTSRGGISEMVYG